MARETMADGSRTGSRSDGVREGGEGVEHVEKFEKDGTVVEIRMKADCRTQEDLNEAVSFMAQSARKFYLNVAKKISSTL